MSQDSAAREPLATYAKATDTGWRNFKQLAPTAYAQLLALADTAPVQGLSPLLIELVKVLCSHTNGCAFCVHMHSKTALKHGATQVQLDQLVQWPHCTAFDSKQYAALVWAQALTQLELNTPWPTLRAAARVYFSAQELVDLSVAITTINAWNRLAVAHAF